MNFVVIDFEAEIDFQGIHFPTEVGLCIPGKAPISAFVKAEPDWHIDRSRAFNPDLWHLAQNKGQSVKSIRSRLQALLEGRQVISDAAFFDQRLLNRLEVPIDVIEFFPLAERLAKERNISPSTVNSWINDIDSRRTVSHRAGPDAWVRAELLSRILS